MNSPVTSAASSTPSSTKTCLFFTESTESDFHLLGGKGASLASMSLANLPVPIGFCVTTNAYLQFLVESSITDALMKKVEEIDCSNLRELDACSEEIREMILEKPMPLSVEEQIKTYYKELCAQCGANNDLPVAVRSSANAEDLPDASFAGQQDTYLWVVGEDEVLAHVRKCWASLFTSRAINYRRNQQIAETDVLMCVVIQKMVNARTAGVAMTLNPTNGDRSKIVIDASWGLGEAVVSGEVTPDNFLVDKIMLSIITASIQNKHIEHVPDKVNRKVITHEIEGERATQPSLSDEEVKEVCRMAKIIEKHYKCPQDIEWAIDADLPAGQNFTLLQSRPETVWSQKKPVAAPATQFGMQGLVSTLMNPLAHKK
ncbi:MAG: PEP/pyruvate-binding domain-containing protein [Spirosomataceae bacterium]